MKLLRQTVTLMRYMCRCMSSEAPETNTAVISRQNKIFNQEKERQLALVKRIEKIEVKHLGLGPDNPCKLMMNKYLSTPYHVAMHFDQTVLHNSALAMVNGRPWHMLQPLTEDCELRFVTMKDDDVAESNQAFWRACSHMMGAVLSSAFKDDVAVELARVPGIPVSLGCFAYDINLPCKWEPSREELTCLNRQAFTLTENNVNFERLEVSRELAHTIFQDRVYKTHQVDQTDDDKLVLFRLGDFIDISDGPMVTSSGFMQSHRYVFACVHSFDDYLKPGNKLLRFQGVALPSEFRVHHTTWSIIEDRARKPVLIDLAPTTSLKASHEGVLSQVKATS